jgi:hypothetical protein
MNHNERDPNDPEPTEDRGENTPITPHATPTIDALGRITYIGDDGRRYVVADPPAPECG